MGIRYKVINKDDFEFDFNAPLRLYRRDGHFIARGQDGREKRARIAAAVTKEAQQINAAVGSAFAAGKHLPIMKKVERENTRYRQSDFFRHCAAYLHDRFHLDVDARLEERIAEKMDKLGMSASARNARFRAKAELNAFSYFVTITYDDAKMCEDDFSRKLRRRFSNLAQRYGWKVIGAFERGHGSDDDNWATTGRLHFHGLVQIPEGAMLHDLETRKVYSRKKQRVYEMHSHPDFSKTFGLNDFCPISDFEVAHGNVVGYICKYVLKSGGQLFYSRHVPAEISVLMSRDWVLADWFDHVPKLVFQDDLQWIRMHTQDGGFVDYVMRKEQQRVEEFDLEAIKERLRRSREARQLSFAV